MNHYSVCIYRPVVEAGANKVQATVMDMTSSNKVDTHMELMVKAVWVDPMMSAYSLLFLLQLLDLL